MGALRSISQRSGLQRPWGECDVLGSMQDGLACVCVRVVVVRGRRRGRTACRAQQSAHTPRERQSAHRVCTRAACPTRCVLAVSSSVTVDWARRSRVGGGDGGEPRMRVCERLRGSLSFRRGSCRLRALSRSQDVVCEASTCLFLLLAGCRGRGVESCMMRRRVSLQTASLC